MTRDAITERIDEANSTRARIVAANPALAAVADAFAADDKARALRAGSAPSAPNSGTFGDFSVERAPFRRRPILGAAPASWAGDGPIYRPGDADEIPFAPVEAVPAASATLAAERLFHEYCARETGREANTERDLEREQEKATLTRQTHDFALLLEQGGIPAYRRDQWAVWRYRPLSDTWETVAKWRRSLLLPAVAAMIRAPLIRSLEHYLDRHPFARFFTFTSGRRVTLAQLPDRLDEHFRELGRLNTWLSARWGWRFVFRSTELGTPETADGKHVRQADQGRLNRDEAGQVLFHPHSHCVLSGPYLPPAKWEKMLSEIWSHWGHFWDEGGMVRNVRECCKYLTKPAEMLELTPAEAAGLFNALYRRKLVCPLGELRDEIRAREDAGLTLRRHRLANGEGSIWREELDHNRHRTKASKERLDAEAGEKLGKDRKGGCYVCSLQIPTRGPLGLTEPSCIVMGTTWDREAVRRDRSVREMVAAAMPAWVRAQLARKAGDGLSPVRVHTCTPTPSFQTEAPFAADIEPRTAPPTPPVFATA